MTNEETKEAVVEETEVKTEELKSVEATGENTEQDTTGDEDELSPWYYFFSQGCGWCKKSTPVVEELNKEGKLPEILLLDTAEPDNAKLRDELFAEYKVQCGTPFFINADTGENICGFREKDVLTKWLNGEHIPAPPRVKGRMPKPPLHGASEKEETTWTGEYNKWLQENDHMGEDFKSKQRTAKEILEAPRPKTDPPVVPNLSLPATTEESIDAWAKEVEKWQKENDHLPNLQNPDNMVQQLKARWNQMQGKPPAVGGRPNTAASDAKLNTLEAKISALEVKLDKVMNHFGVK